MRRRTPLSADEARDLERPIRALIRRHFGQVPGQVADADDLYQYGMLRVLHRAPDYDSDSAASFLSFALMHAHYGIQDALRALAPGTRTHPEPPPVSLEQPLRDNEDATLGDTLVDDRDEFTDPFDSALLERALRTLTLDEQSAVAMYFGDDEPTLAEIAECFGVTESRLSQIIGRALEKLRAQPDLQALAA